MTQEQTDLLIKLSAPLVATPKSWLELSEAQRDVFMLLLPSNSFTEEQYYWLSFWWLKSSVEELAALNSLCPPNTTITGREHIHGDIYVSCDLLSDALYGGSLSALLPILETLPITFKPAEEWPVSENVDI